MGWFLAYTFYCSKYKLLMLYKNNNTEIENKLEEKIVG